MLKTIVIGAGQAGLTAAHYLAARGMLPHEDFVVLDQNEGPGGAWRHRWDSLTFEGAHAIHPLPRFPIGTVSPSEPSSALMTRYYGAFEDAHDLPILRPVRVENVGFEGDHFRVETNEGDFEAEVVINATGTWDSPYIPYYPGVEHFRGKHVHTAQFENAAQFAGKRVLVVGGGASAAQHVQELAESGVETVWSTRGVPRWTATPFDDDWGAAVETRVAARTKEGLRPLSVVAETGLPLTSRYLPEVQSGVLLSRGPISRFSKGSVTLTDAGSDGRHIPSQGEAEPFISTQVRGALPPLPGKQAENGEGWEVPVDAVLWATGFRPHIPHLASLRLREKTGGIKIADDGVTAVKMPNFLFTGYGASASTLGASRAGRVAAAKAVRLTR